MTINLIGSLALTATGALDDAVLGPGKRFASAEDGQFLKQLRDKAQAVVMGRKTFEAWPKPHAGLIKPAEALTHIVVSRRPRPPVLPEAFAAVPVCWYQPTSSDPKLWMLDWQALLGEAATVLAEGGEQLMQTLLASGVIDCLYLTVYDTLMAARFLQPGYHVSGSYAFQPPYTLFRCHERLLLLERAL